MVFKFSDIERAVTPFFGLIAPQLEDQGGQIGTLVGQKLNNEIEGTETQFDDKAKEALIAFLKGMTEALEVDGVVSDEPSETGEADV